MISSNQIKNIKRLHLKKFRQEERLFIAETPKVIMEMLKSPFIETQEIWALEPWIDQYWKRYPSHQLQAVSPKELERLSTLSSPNQVLGIFQIPNYPLVLESLQTELILALDGISDPGNLGTIIRIADWFGIQQILCSNDSVEYTNPKCVQASMGSIARVKIHYVELEAILPEIQTSVWGTFLDGENIYQCELPQHGCLLIGNEAHGIRANCENLVQHRIHIPSFAMEDHAESLNASIATAIACSEWRRQALSSPQSCVS